MLKLADDSPEVPTLLADEPGCTVLLADDDELVREKMGALLQSAGYAVRSAASGAEALRLFNETPARIIVTDWEMPEMDGIALCRNLRERGGRREVYILLLTVRTSHRDQLRGFDAGADDYVIKSVAPEELLARLNVGRRATEPERGPGARGGNQTRQTLIDPLTGTGNHLFLHEYLWKEYERSRRHVHALAVLCCDLDHLSRIDQSFGYDAGDSVLESFCGRAALVLRSSDWIARVGGEDFVIVLPETDLKGARTVSEKIRRSVAQKPARTPAGPVAVTVSIGYCAMENPTQLRRFGPEDLLRTAGEQLVAAKRAGRNQCAGSTVSGPQLESEPTTGRTSKH